MLPQGFLENGWEKVISASIWTTATAALVWLVYFLIQRGAFGVRTLYPGDCAIRTLFGRPMNSHMKPKSLFFIAIIYDVRIVSTRRTVHDPFRLDVWTTTPDGKDSKWHVTVNVHSRVEHSEKAVENAIFALGDSENSNRKNNDRIRLIEQMIKSQLTVAATTVAVPADINLTQLVDAVNAELYDTTGTNVIWCQLTDIVPSEAQVIAGSLQSLKP